MVKIDRIGYYPCYFKALYVMFLSMLNIFLSVIFSLFFIFNVFYNFFFSLNRFRSLKVLISETLKSLLKTPLAFYLLYFLFVSFFLTNLLGNIPLNLIPTMFYRFTLTFSLLFWVSIIICVRLTDLKNFLAHILPYGSPAALMLFLPLVELFSQVIRPLTLMIRLRTNLSSGHIMMYMFSYFTLLSSALSPFIYIVLYLLFFLELAISALQAYIFSSLLALYVEEVV